MSFIFRNIARINLFSLQLFPLMVDGPHGTTVKDVHISAKDPNKLKEEGNAIFRSGDYTGAAATFQRAIDVFGEVNCPADHFRDHRF